MTDTTQPKRGGKAFHSILEPHFESIRDLRQRRKTWQEIAGLLFIEKGIRVTLYAPYRFYRRRLKRAAEPSWENAGNNSEAQPVRPTVAASQSQSRPSPLPQQNAFKRPDPSKLTTEEYHE